VSLEALPQLQVAPDIASGAPATLPIGALGPSFDGLLGVDGQRYGMADFDEHAILVLIFSSNRCPTAKAYTDRLNEVQAKYGPRGVQLVMINSNDPHLYPEESYARMVSLSREMGYTFPYLLDEGQRVARAYGPTRTFHVFALDRERRLRYEGRFDDARVAASVTTHDLANALDDLLAGHPVRVAQTRAFGCSLDIL
jgi:thiol-disulfide isomerase/thioredoxin